MLLSNEYLSVDMEFSMSILCLNHHGRFFTALHWMQTRSSAENSVCLSVRLSVCLSNAWFVIKQKKVMPAFLYHLKNIYPSFVTRRMVGRSDPF